MTPQEYRTKLDALKKQEVELAEEFIKNNPFKKLEGKLVDLTIGCGRLRVFFVGAGFTKDIFGKPDELGLFFHHLKKDGTPRKNHDFIPVKYYDGKTYKIDEIKGKQYAENNV